MSESIKHLVHEALLADILADAKLRAPTESCGLLVRLDANPGWVVYVSAMNLSNGPHEQFVLDPVTWAQCEDIGEIVAVVHSHPNASANPSMADRAGCERSGVPWLIVGWPSGALVEVLPEGWSAPLEGREWCAGVHDCYALLQDYFLRTHTIELPDFEREWGWWEKGQNLYRDGLAAAGFAEVRLQPGELPQVGDGLLMRIRSPDIDNHAAVYLGDGMMLHHLVDQISRRERWDKPWQLRTTAVVRHHRLAGAAT